MGAVSSRFSAGGNERCGVWVLVPAGSVLEAMAEAVENAAVVIVCLTQKYKESPNCRTG